MKGTCAAVQGGWFGEEQDIRRILVNEDLGSHEDDGGATLPKRKAERSPFCSKGETRRKVEKSSRANREREQELERRRERDLSSIFRFASVRGSLQLATVLS